MYSSHPIAHNVRMDTTLIPHLDTLSLNIHYVNNNVNPVIMEILKQDGANFAMIHA